MAIPRQTLQTHAGLGLGGVGPGLADAGPAVPAGVPPRAWFSVSPPSSSAASRRARPPAGFGRWQRPAAAWLACGSLALLAWLAWPAVAAAQTLPQEMTYQGRLLDAGGAASTGPVDLTLSVYDAATAGNLLYAETHGAVALDAGGGFVVALGGGTPSQGVFDAGLFASGAARYLETQVDTDVLSPRQPLASMPWSLVAQEAVSVQNAPTLVADVTHLKLQVGSLPAGSSIADQLAANSADASLALAQSVSGASVNAAGYLEVTLSNSTVLNAGPVSPAASAWDTMLWAPSASAGQWK